MIEADPVDALAFPTRIAIAQLNPPDRRILFADIFESTLPSIVLAVHAARVPTADETDVEEDRIVERRR